MKGCSPAGRSELPDEAVGWVASQVKVPASDLGLFDWEGRTAERARKTVRTFLGFRECSVADAEELTTWLADEVCSRERHAQRVREALLAKLREEQIEQPSKIRLGRMIGSALRQSEETLTAKVSSRLDNEVTARMWSMIAAAGDDPGVPPGEGPGGWQGAADGSDPGEVPGPEVWAAIRSDPGNISLNTCKSERRKLDWIRAVRLPSGVLDVLVLQVPAAVRSRRPQPVKLLLDALRLGWRVAETRAYAATRISVFLGDQRQAGQAALPGLTRQQLVGLIPPALAVLARAVLAAHGPGPGHRALLPGQHRCEEQIPATAADSATRSGSAAPAARSRTCHL